MSFSRRLIGCVIGSARTVYVVALMSALSMMMTIAIVLRMQHINVWRLGVNSDTQDVAEQPPLLCLFTTFKPKDYKLQTYRNTILNRVSLSPIVGQVRPILFDTAAASYGNESSAVTESLNDLARQVGWQVFESTRTTPHGVPYFKEMYFEAARRIPNCTFYGFTNGDILFSRGLVGTLEAVDKVTATLNQTLVIGRRTNVNINTLPNRSVYVSDDVERVARTRGKLWRVSAIDFFFVHRNNFPWTRVPDIVIGRSGYDNFVVGVALNNRVSVVDATNTVVAVHQTDDDGIGAGRRNAENNVNFAAIGKFNFAMGRTSRSQYLTAVSAAGGLQANGSSSRGAGGVVVLRRATSTVVAAIA